MDKSFMKCALLFSMIFCLGLAAARDLKAADSPKDTPAQEATDSSAADHKAPLGVEADKLIPLPLTTDRTAIRELEEKEVQAELILKTEKELVEHSKGLVDELQAEIRILKDQAKLKEDTAAALKKELELMKEEASLTRNKDVLKKVKEVERQIEEHEKEANLYQNQVSLVETKAALAERTIQTREQSMEALKNELAKLRLQKGTKIGLLDRLIQAVFMIALGVGLFFLLIFGIKKFEEFVTPKDAIRESEFVLRMKTISALFKWLGSILIFGMMTYSVLGSFGIDMAPLLAGAGIVGLAFGFGGQYLIRDIINGIFILIEGQYRINDVVKIGELGGLVEGVNLRVTRLRDLEGRVIFIPNGEIKSVINFTKEFSQAVLDIGVAYKENVDQVMTVMKDVCREMREDPYFRKLILQDMEMLGVDNFANSAVIVKARIKTLPIKQWEVAREYRRRLKNRFDELGIEIPFPHTTLYWGTGKDNDWWREKAK